MTRAEGIFNVRQLEGNPRANVAVHNLYALRHTFVYNKIQITVE